MNFARPVGGNSISVLKSYGKQLSCLVYHQRNVGESLVAPGGYWVVIARNVNDNYT